MRTKSRNLYMILAFLMLLIFVSTSAAAEEERVTRDDIIKFAGSLTVQQNEVITGDVFLFSGDAVIDGKVQGDVVVFAGNIEVNGEVLGDVTCFSGNIDKGDHGIIHGSQINLAEGLNFHGLRHNLPGLFQASPFWAVLGRGLQVMSLLGFLALGALITALTPDTVDSMGSYLKTNYLRAGLIGLIALIVVPFVSLILLLSIVGIPIIPLFLLAAFLAGFFGYLGIANLIGQKMVSAFRWSDSQILQAIIGIITLWLILQLPLINIVIWLVLAILSLGTIIDTKFGTMKPWFPKQVK